MRTRVHKTAQLGDLVLAAFDEAARYSIDPREVSRLATQAVAHILRRARAPDGSAGPRSPVTATERTNAHQGGRS